MSPELTRLLSALVYPLSQSLLLILFGLLALRLGRRRVGFFTVLVATAWLYLCSTGYVADFFMGILERDYPPRAMSVVPAADAIVLLGGGTRGYAHMGTLADLNQHADRLLHAAALYKAGKAPVLLLSGGAPGFDTPEAEQMRDILLVMGVPGRAMLLEERSLSTHDNALFSADLLRARGLERILLVTSAFHMRRAAAVFEAQGLHVTPAPTDYKRLVAPDRVPAWLPHAGSLARTSYALHELVGYEVYRWRGWLAPAAQRPAADIRQVRPAG